MGNSTDTIQSTTIVPQLRPDLIQPVQLQQDPIIISSVEAPSPIMLPHTAPVPTERNVSQSDLENLQAAAIAQITPEELTLYTRSGKACCWKDASEFEFRLKQLQLINHAVKILAQELWKDAEIIDFQLLHNSTMTYLSVDGMIDQSTTWSILSEDKTFKPNQLVQNRFKDFETYFTDKTDVTSRKEVKKDFENFLTIFIRLRDGLIQLMAKSCS